MRPGWHRRRRCRACTRRRARGRPRPRPTRAPPDLLLGRRAGCRWAWRRTGPSRPAGLTAGPCRSCRRSTGHCYTETGPGGCCWAAGRETTGWEPRHRCTAAGPGPGPDPGRAEAAAPEAVVGGAESCRRAATRVGTTACSEGLSLGASWLEWQALSVRCLGSCRWS